METATMKYQLSDEGSKVCCDIVDVPIQVML